MVSAGIIAGGVVIYQLAKKTRKSGKEKANDVPDYAKGETPNPGESGKDFAKRIMDKIFGEGKYKKNGSDFNKIKKWIDRRNLILTSIEPEDGDDRSPKEN